MNLKPLGSNKTEINLGNGVKVLFSYETPVAAQILTPTGMEYHVTEEFYSRTTTAHINSWLPKEDRIKQTPKWFHELLVNKHD